MPDVKIIKKEKADELLRVFVDEINKLFAEEGLGVFNLMARGEKEKCGYYEDMSHTVMNKIIIHDIITHNGVKTKGEEIGQFVGSARECAERLISEIRKYINKLGVHEHGLIWRCYPEVKELNGLYHGRCRLSIYDNQWQQVILT